MRTGTLKINPTGPAWLKTGIGLALFAGIGILLHGILLSVEYRWHRVVDVASMAGRDVHYRMVLIDTPERMRVLRTSDPLIRVEKGAWVCVSKRRMIARQWLRHNVALPGYCRSQPRPTLPATVLSAD